MGWRKEKVWPKDPETGLPELPEGFFWEVTSNRIALKHRKFMGHTPEYVNYRPNWWKPIVRIAQKTPCYQNTLIACTYLDNWDGAGTIKEYIASCANTLRIDSKGEVEELLRADRTRAATADYVGDYPPKKL